MRIILLALALGAFCIALPSRAIADKAKVAIAPFKGDAGNKISKGVVDALSDNFEVIGPKEVKREMEKLGLSDAPDAKESRKLARKLGALAVVYGQVGKARGRKKTLRLDVHRRGKPESDVTIELKSPKSTVFKRAVRDEVGQRIDADGGGGDDDEEAVAENKKKRDAEDEDKKRKADEDDKRRVAEEDDRKRKADEDDKQRRADDDEGKRKRGKRVASEDDDEGRTRKRGRASSSASEAPAGSRVRLHVGGGFAQRALTYTTRAGFTQVPPRVGTAAGAGRVDGEIYPFLLAEQTGALASLGLAGSYDKTFGLSIDVPGQTVSAPISQSHYSIGARYRFVFGGAASVAFGLDYASRQFVADRSGLGMAVLDAPDITYKAVVPGASAHVPIGSGKLALLAGVHGMLILDTGPIQTAESYGAATVYGLGAIAGVDIGLTPQIGVRIAGEYNQINFTFDGTGTQSKNRDANAADQDVMGAVDRAIGVVAMVGIVY